MPDGFTVQEETPTNEQLEFGNAAGDSLLGRQLLYKWAGFGWVQGEIEKRNGNKKKTIAGDNVNFVVYYAMDDNHASHVLEAAHYAWGDTAKTDSWVLLRRVTEEE